MYPYLRAARVVATTRASPDLAPDDVVVFRTRCWPWDADMFGELNNGRHLTMFDLGRFAHGARFGLFALLRARRWGLVVGGGFVQYRKRIQLMRRFEIASRLIARDAKWFFYEQATRRDGVICSSALMRVAVVDGPTGTVPTQVVAEAVGHGDWHGSLPDWAVRLAEADSARPWPPEGL
ncbi:MAG: acyl-CoA thioesterase [Pseudomonadota bacterium]